LIHQLIDRPCVGKGLAIPVTTIVPNALIAHVQTPC
jgi:hypothetical protein